MFSCSHQSTFDRLYAREKKLYQEVRVHLKSQHFTNFFFILIYQNNLKI
ncbi:hypothetical protein NC652_040269 [Populus alba x Populus x berolinensis]|nr:hypothetical protein NC652_040269 [Populus alba x Populus x berolinensis]